MKPYNARSRAAAAEFILAPQFDPTFMFVPFITQGVIALLTRI